MTTPDTDPFGLDDQAPLSHRGTVSRETSPTLPAPRPPDLRLALRFLEFVHPTPQVYILAGPDRRWPKGDERERKSWGGQLVSSIPSTLEIISEHQQQFRTIQFTPNILNGPRSAVNVTHLNCIYADVDKDVAEQERILAELCAEYDFHPHIKLETRPGKYQYFWLINQVEKTPSTLGKYRQVAWLLRNRLRHASEGTSTDIAHFMRVPGCTAYRQDGNFYTDQLYLNGHIPRYSLEELSGKFPPGDFTPKYVTPAPHSIQPGERNTSVLQYVAHAATRRHPTVEDLEIARIGFIQYAIKPEDRAGIVEETKDIPGRTHEKMVVPQLQVEAHQNFSIKPDEQLRETHPEEFYLGLPGGVGDVVRYLSHHAPHIPAACHFVATFTLLSPVAAYSVKDVHGNTPTTYMGIVAKSGTGKTVPYDKLRSALIGGGFDPDLFFTSDGASDMGMVKLLQKFGGIGSLYTEEAYDFLNSRTSKQTASYALGIFTWLLKLHSAHSQLGVTRGPTLKEIERNEGKKSSLDKIDCPRLSWGYGIQPDFFKEHFLDNKYLVTQGFAGRTLNIVAHSARSSGNQVQLTVEHEQKLWEIVSRYPCTAAALELQYATYGLLPVEVAFTPVGPPTPAGAGVIEVPPEHVHVNGHTNGNGHSDIALDVVPAHMEKPSRKRGRPKKDAACGEQELRYGFLPNPPEPITTRSTPEVAVLGYSSVGQSLLDEFNAHCRLRSDGTAASASIWTRGLDQAIRISIFLRAFGAGEVEAITSATTLVRGCFLNLDTAYHSSGADRASESGGSAIDYRKRIYVVLLELKEASEAALIRKVSSNPKMYWVIKDTIKTEVRAGHIVEAPGRTNGTVLRLIRVAPEFQ